MSQTLLVSKNEVIAQKLLPYWKRAVSRLVPASTATTTTTIFESTFKKIIEEMHMPFASHQEELDFLKNDERDRQVMKRAYHNINHVLELCELFENEVLPALQKQESSSSTTTSTTLPDHDIIFLTAFFHDVIYDAKKGDNEEKSDDMWKNFASSLLTKDDENGDDATTTRTIKSIQKEVSEIILATKSHLKWKPSEDLGKQAILNTLTFLDMDLAILGTNPERYAQYSTQIKIEYQHIAPKDFCSGRLSFLEGMVGSSSSSPGDNDNDDNNKSPFFTETMKKLRGEQTTKNMRWEMEELKKEREKYSN